MPEFVVSSVSDDLCLRVGRIATKWPVIEKLTSLLLGTCLMADQAAVSVIANAIASSTQAKWIRALLSAREHEAVQNKRVSELLLRFDDIRAERNELIHGIWDQDERNLGVAMVETTNLERNEIIRSRLVTAHDLDDLLGDIDEWIRDYVSLGREIGFPRQRGEASSMFAD